MEDKNKQYLYEDIDLDEDDIDENVDDDEEFVDDDKDVDKSLMSGWMKNILSRNRKLFISIAVILLLVVLGIFGYIISTDKKSEKRMREVTVQINQLTQEVADYEAQILALQERYGNAINGKSCVVLAFTDMVNGENEQVINYMNEKGYTGVMIFNHTNVPGSEKGISVDKYNKLIAKGWEAAIGTDGSTPLTGVVQDAAANRWKTYVEDVKKQFEKNGLEVPKVYCFREEESYKSVCDKLKDLGFNTYISINNTGENAWFSAANMDDGVLKGVQADYNYIDVRRDIEKYNKISYSTVLLFNTIELSYPQYDLETKTSYSRFKMIVDCLLGYEDTIMVTNVTGYKNYQSGAGMDYTTERQSYKEECSKIESKIEEALRKIEELKKEAGY